MKTSLDILEQKIKDRMEWFKAQDDFDLKWGLGQYEICYSELDEVLEMIEEIKSTQSPKAKG